MKKKSLSLAIAITACLSSFTTTTANAGLRQYAASLSDSHWQVTQNSRLACQLEHRIPRYGTAKFLSNASRELNLDFVLDMKRLPDTYSLAEVRSVSPAWRPGQADRAIADMKLYKQFNPSLPKKAAWTILSELEMGMNPTFFYRDWYDGRNGVSVGLSTAKFRKAYDDFIDCQANLLNFSFEDIAYTVLNYQVNSDKLTKSSMKRLSRIREYLTHDTELELVLIDAYTDSYGSKSTNERLSRQRANKLRDYFVSNGVDVSRIESTGYGERRHIAPNDNVLGRGTNRRVVIRMDKP